MKPPDELLNWAARSAKRLGLRPTMLELAAAIAGERGVAATHMPPPQVPLPPTAPVDWLGQVYETLLAAKTRRSKGVHFTPPEIAAEVVAQTLEGMAGPLRIMDPAMGCGAFLLAAARYCRGACRAATFTGFDTDPLAVELAQISLSIETGLPLDAFDSLRQGDALLEAKGEFDAIIGNPPFGNAIEKRTARSADYAAKLRALYPEFAQGAYDYSLLFFGLATRLLAPAGRYGLIGPTALLSDAKPWQPYMHANFRPRALLSFPMGAFGARVRTTAFIGARGPCDTVAVRGESGARGVQGWRDGPWFETAIGAPRVESSRVLGDMADIFAGCATGAAYELAPLVTDSAFGAHGQGRMKLVTTGALDRFRCTWGERSIRFLGRDFARPMWPQSGPRAVMAALTRQGRPKILVGGLTSVLEAWYDEAGSAAGVVSTWVIAPKAGVNPWLALALLNSATMSRLYFARHGAKSMSGMQTTICKRGLLELPWPHAAGKEAARLAELASVLQGGGAVEGPDRELHRLAARVLGRSGEEAEADREWWQARAAKRRNPQSGNGLSEC